VKRTEEKTEEGGRKDVKKKREKEIVKKGKKSRIRDYNIKIIIHSCSFQLNLGATVKSKHTLSLFLSYTHTHTHTHTYTHKHTLSSISKQHVLAAPAAPGEW